MITLKKLKLQNGKFWWRVLYAINVSHYFSKLGWGFKAELKNSVTSMSGSLAGGTTSPTLVGIEAISTNNLDEITRTLIKNIFRLPPNFQRRAREPLPEPESPVRQLIQVGSPQRNRPNNRRRPEDHSRYPGYPLVELVSNAIRPLTEADIELEDVEMFKNKLRVAWEDNLEAVIKEKLIVWQELITSRRN